jgi:predicted transcriptional regulator of viral defense system
MNYGTLLNSLGKQGFFDLASVVQLSNDKRETIRTQLYRWCQSGKLIGLRRGMYAFSEAYSKAPLHAAELANHLYHPSYISTQWAMSFYGLIPEKTVTYTCVSPRVSRTFENPFGLFNYQSLKTSVFFGYGSQTMAGKTVTIADPEKALLDFWYLQKGNWTLERIQEMRFQNTDLIDKTKLLSYAERFQSPRLLSIAKRFWSCSKKESQGTKQL